MTRSNTYDLRGLNCPLPVLRTRKRLANMQPGAMLIVETTDPLAAIDIPVFCRDEGHRLVATEAVPNGHRFTIERGPAAST
ncbi:MAG: sulfurtransferase TusA family protein [Rhizobiaceae bacterium]|nr:sulfurtransferase TusA family protein [Rhizobiaceae bacterium]